MSKGNRNRTLRNERRANQMNEQNANMEEMRLKRIANHPLDVKGNYIVMDNLEGGTIKVFLHTDEDYALNIQFYNNEICLTGVTLVGKISISVSEEEKAVLIDELYYSEGHEELRNALVNQVKRFANFYGKYENIGIAYAVLGKENWFADLLGE